VRIDLPDFELDRATHSFCHLFNRKFFIILKWWIRLNIRESQAMSLSNLSMKTTTIWGVSSVETREGTTYGIELATSLSGTLYSSFWFKSAP